MIKLYIIGNGFDLHHGLSTSYENFAKYLEAHNSELLEHLHQYYPIEPGQNLWSKFEENLANLDKDYLLESLSEYLPVPSSDDFSDRDYGAAGIQSNTVLGSLTNGLRSEFSQFIIKAATKEIDKSKLVQIDATAQFISFNYTQTLEKEYFIPSENIFYIHGKACEGEDIVLGHATNPQIFQDEQAPVNPPEGASEEESERWYDEMSDQHDPIYEALVDDVNEYFLTSYKDTNQVIQENTHYFNALTNTDELRIYGHSLSDVDMPYFEKIASIVKYNCCWIISYYEENEKKKIELALEHLNVSSEFIQLIKLNGILSKRL